MKKYLRWIVIGLAAFIMLLVIINAYLVPRDSLQSVDAVVAVSGGDTQERAQAAVALYLDGWADTIIFSGAAADPDSPSNAEIMQRYAVASGVPESDIILEEFAFDTAQNAEKTQGIIEENEYRSIILVTSGYHQRRVFREFNARLDGNVEILNYPAEDRQWDERLWWSSPFGWYLVSSELAKNLFLTFTL